MKYVYVKFTQVFYFAISGLMQSGEILQTPLAVFDTADDEDTMQSNDSGGNISYLLYS